MGIKRTYEGESPVMDALAELAGGKPYVLIIATDLAGGSLEVDLKAGGGVRGLADAELLIRLAHQGVVDQLAVALNGE